ncbi:MAG: hypothetical protein FH761_16210 [Firmicutes bacterium]|nr:hypothetical protein [Bacillota bacterium]
MPTQRFNNNKIYYLVIGILCIMILFLSIKLISKIFNNNEGDTENKSVIEKQDYERAVTAFLNIDGSKKEIKSNNNQQPVSQGNTLNNEKNLNYNIDNFFLRVLLNSNSYMKLAYDVENHGTKNINILMPEVMKLTKKIEPLEYLRSQFPAIISMVDARKEADNSQYTYNSGDNQTDNVANNSNSNNDKFIDYIIDGSNRSENSGDRENTKDTNGDGITSPEEHAEAGDGIYIYEQSLEQAGIDLSNFTTTVNASEIASLIKVKPISVDEKKPYVLIYHTHGTEAYFPNNKKVFYSTDLKDNVTNIGEIVTAELNSNGHDTKHVTKYHDVESFNDSYTKSLATAKSELKKEENLKVIFDIHRDGVDPNTADMDEAYRRFKTEINGKQVATFTMVIGPDNPNFNEILKFAQYIKAVSDVMYPGLCRGIIQKNYGKFNQYISDHAALIEVGSNINSVEEAEATAKLIGDVLNNVIEGMKK